MKILTAKESEAFERKYGADQVLDSGFVDRWKPQDDGTVLAKSRHVVRCWQEPIVLQVERTAPAPSQEGEAATLQVIASEGWDAYVGDVRNAFGQSLKTNRGTPLACRQQPEGIPGMQPGEFLLMLTECYGLISGPAWWRVTQVSAYEAEGYKRNQMTRA